MALTERLMILIDSQTGGAVSGFKRVQSEAQKSESLIGKLADRAGVSGSTMKAAIGVGAVGAVVALGTAAAATVGKFFDLANQVDDFQDVAGGTAEQASQLVNVTKQLGIAPEVASKAFFTLGKTVGAGTSSLSKYGIEVAKNRDGTTDLVGTLANVSSAYQRTADQADKNAIAAAAFGKAGAGLPDLLSLTKDQLQALGNIGPVFSQDEIDKAKELQIQLKGFHQEVDKAEAKVGSFVASGLEKAVYGVRKLGEGLHLLPQGFADSNREMDKLTGQTLANVEASKRAADEQKAEMDAADKLSASLFGTANAKRALEASTRAEQDAEETLTEKRKVLNDLLRQGAVDAKAVAAAQKQVETAERNLATASERVVAAQEALAKAKGYSADDLAEADLNRRDALLGVADAQDRVQSAQEALTEAQNSGDPEAIDDATRDLAEANIGLERAQRNAAAAQKAQNDLNPNSEAGTKRVKDAERDLWNATQDQTTAAQDLWTATVNLNTARAGDPDFLQNVAAKNRDVKDAEQNLADAKWNHLQNAVALQGALDKENGLLAEQGKQVDIVRWKLAQLAGDYPGFAMAIGGVASPLNAFGANDPRPAGVAGPTLAGVTNVNIQVTSLDPNAVIGAIQQYTRTNGGSWARALV